MEHTARVILTTSRGSIGSHFSQYFGRDHFSIPIPLPGDDEGNGGGYVWIDFPGKSDYRKLMMRDDDRGPHVTADNGWDQQITFQGPGIFILDLSDWDDDPNAHVQLLIDGQVVWEASGTSDNYRDWNITGRAPNVRVTDDREIAIDIAT